MPVFNTVGDFGQGVAGELVSINNVQVSRPGYWAGGACWETDDTLLYQTGRGQVPADANYIAPYIERYTISTGLWSVVSTSGANDLMAGNGKWMAWLSGQGVRGNATVTSPQWSPINAGLPASGGLVFSGRDGSFIVYPNRQTPTDMWVVSPSGVVTKASLTGNAGARYRLDPRVYGTDDAVFLNGAGALETVQGRTLKTLPGSLRGPILFDWNATEYLAYLVVGQGTVCHPALDSTDPAALTGLSIGPAEGAYNLDLVVIGTDLHVCYSRTAGELPGDVVTAVFASDPSDPITPPSGGPIVGGRKLGSTPGVIRRGRAPNTGVAVGTSAHSGGCDCSSGGPATIADNSITLAKLAHGTALSVLGVAGNAAANYADIVAASDKQVLRRSGTTIAFGAIDISSSSAVTGRLALANVAQGAARSLLGVTGTATADYADITAGTDGHVMRRNGTTIAFGSIDLSLSATVGTSRLVLANLVQGAGLSVLGVTGSSTADYAAITAASDYQVMRRSGSAIAFGSIDLSQSAAVGSSKLAWANLADVSATNRILGRKSSGAGVIEELTQADALAILGFAAPGDAIQTGTGNPQGILSAGQGNLYRDTNNGYLYRKVGGGSTAYGWYLEHSAALVEGPLPFLAITGVNTGSAIFGGASGYGPFWGAAGVALFATATGVGTKVIATNGKVFAVGTTSGTAPQTSVLETLNSGEAKYVDDAIDIWAWIRTDTTAVTVTRIWFGLTGSSFSDTTAAPGYTGTVNCLLIRYLSDGNAVWEGNARSTAGGTANVATSSLGSCAAGTFYKLRIRFVRSGTPTVYFSVNDGTEVSTTSNIPATGVALFLTLAVEQISGATAKSIAWRAMGGSVGS